MGERLHWVDCVVLVLFVVGVMGGGLVALIASGVILAIRYQLNRTQKRKPGQSVPREKDADGIVWLIRQHLATTETDTLYKVPDKDKGAHG